MRRRPQTVQLIVALDVPTLPAALRMARTLRRMVSTVKIGSVLFTRVGPEAIRRLRALGFSVMLDLKFHDIPSTVEHSVRAAVQHRVAMLTVHASGGTAMLKAAARAARIEAVRRRVPRPRILGVTVLTSDGTSGGTAVRRRVVALARAALRAGCDGVIASAHEAAAVRKALGPRALIVCPGIRPAGASRGDQARVATPRAALQAGADALVVGRPITTAGSPAQAAAEILCDMEQAAWH